MQAIKIKFIIIASRALRNIMELSDLNINMKWNANDMKIIDIYDGTAKGRK